MTTPTDNPTHPAAGEELKPCPFCGEKPSLCNDPGLWFVDCPNRLCAVLIRVNGETPELATVRWNTRAESPDLTAERQKREAVEKELESVRTVGVEERGRLIKDRDTLKARVAELEGELARINVSWTETVKTGQQINEENKRLSGELATLRQELEAANGQKEEIRKQAVAFVQDGKSLSEANDRLERQLADSTAQVEAMTKALRGADKVLTILFNKGSDVLLEKIGTRGALGILATVKSALTASAPTDAGQAEMRRCQACNRTWSLEDIANPGYCPHCSNKALAPYTQPADAGAESAKAATGWLPIEMAPKDALLVIWRKSWNSPLIAELTVRGWRPLGGATLVYPPTHWMPLPATPPETTEVRAVEPQAENATGEQKISACAQHGDHHDPSCARCAYLANHYRTGLVNLRSEKPQPQGEQAESAPTIEEHFGQPAGSFAKFVDGQQIAPGHNPDKLTNEQVETEKGWRLLTLKEISDRQAPEVEPVADMEVWTEAGWLPGSTADNCLFAYRRRVTPSEGKGAK